MPQKDRVKKNKINDHILRIKTESNLPDHRTAFPLDDMDRALIEIHQEDVFFSYVEFAEKWGVTVATVRNRIKRLKEAGVMDVILVLNPYKIGYTISSLIGIKVDWRVVDPAQIIQVLENIPGVASVMLVTGRYDIFARYVSPNLDAYHNFLAEELAHIQGVLQFESFIEMDLYEQKFQLSKVRSAKASSKEEK